MEKYFAGIGARSTPKWALDMCQRICVDVMNEEGYILRSGGAKGADTAFEKGAERSNIFTASSAKFSDLRDEYTKIAKKHHPAWYKLSAYVRFLMMRNVMILLGPDESEPRSELVVCWTSKGAVTGGTGHSLRVAQEYEIPVVNIAKFGDKEEQVDYDKVVASVRKIIKEGG